MDKKYTLQVQEDSEGQLYFEFPEEVMQELGWSEGDELLWEETDGGWIIKKDEKNE
jgi:bifunctional DNA-binding transcriptional regulator/antitoxin component of YhaV-PrlF toxin-antitoxin module